MHYFPLRINVMAPPWRHERLNGISFLDDDGRQSRKLGVTGRFSFWMHFHRPSLACNRCIPIHSKYWSTHQGAIVVYNPEMVNSIRKAHWIRRSMCIIHVQVALVAKHCIPWHYNGVIMSTMASRIASLTLIRSKVYSGEDQRNHQSSASLAFVCGIHRWPVNSLYKGPVTRKMFPFDDVIKYEQDFMHCIRYVWYGSLWIHVNNFLIFCSVASLTLGESYDCGHGKESILKKIWL